ncbi:protein LOW PHOTOSYNTHETIC EFFICIENCY 1, chloroplastic [Magnolia sinica]|uniref:protein LOW PHOTOSYNTHETIC EFFICIENCY 1, chloroplastic n=1 Tax=Magnolia sinica TaxID=86752 RepID=UPI0026597635|nr:protein LOW PHOTOSYNTHETIC EFFICIENCY 1, chloroplastic [Magnolia sinica]
MQALSIWPSKMDILATPNLNFDLGSCISKKLWSFGSNLSLVSINSMGISSFRSGLNCRQVRNLDSRNGFSTDRSKPNSVLVHNRKSGSFGAMVGSAWALEQEVGGVEITQGALNLNCGFSEESENDKDSRDTEGGDCENRSKLREEKSGKIDVRALAHSLQCAKTADDVEEVLKDFKELPLPVYSSMIRGFGIDRKLDSAIALVEWLKRKKKGSRGFSGPNLFIYNSLLGALKQSEQFGQVNKVMEDMKKEGIIPNIVTYNTLMAVYLEQGRPKEALGIMAEIQEKGLSPSAVTYSTALLAYRRMEDADGALQFFVETREKYRKGEIGKDAGENWENELVKLENFMIRICYQVMRRWLVKRDHSTTNALKLLADMDKMGLRPGQAEYERLVWACTMEGHYLVAKELYRRIRETESDISLSVCNHLIWLMGKAKKWWAALEIYEDLLDKGPEPNNLSYELIVSHFNILLTAASRRGIWRWGVRLINKMQDKGLKPGSREWNAVLVACSRASETSAAVEIFRRMVEQGEKPTILSYGALLSALEKGKMYDEALRVWEHMCKLGVKPNLHAYTILVSVYIGQGRPEEVDSVIREMVASGNDPTVVTYNAIISGCARNSMGSAAFEWFHRMKVQNITPNEITYEMLIEALAIDAKPRLAYEMYLRARNEGLRLSSKAYDAVVQSSQNYNASIDTSALGPRPAEKRKGLKTRKVLSEFCELADVPRRGKPFHKDEIYTSQTQGYNRNSL